MQHVVFDSSFLMAVAEAPTPWVEDIIDAIGRYDAVIPECVRAELDGIARGSGKRARAARVGLEMASKFVLAPCGKARVDDEIASLALGMKAYVATVDADLAGSLRAAHVRVISLSGGRVSVR